MWVTNSVVLELCGALLHDRQQPGQETAETPTRRDSVTFHLGAASEFPFFKVI